MLSYVFRRLLAMFPNWLILSFWAFSIMDLVPGDPVVILLGPEASPTARAQFVERLGLNKPFFTRYGDWLGGVFRGDLGQALFLGRSVSQAILERARVTVPLGIGALLVAGLLGVPLGTLAAVHQGSLLDTLVMLTAMVGLATPEFLLGLILIFLFAVTLGVLPAGGYAPFSNGVGVALRYFIMPWFALGFSWAALVARMTRASMIEVLTCDYIRTARAKGLPERMVLGKHTLKATANQIVTVLGFVAVLIIGGAFVTEIVFNLPGMGQLLVSAIKRRDYPVVQGVILVTVTGVLLLNLVVDLIYAYLDPRIRYD